MVESAPSGTSPDAANLIVLVREARQHLSPIGPSTDEWLDLLEKQHDALHDLMEDLLGSDPATAQEVAATLWRYWWLRDHMTEGRRFLERATTIEGPDLAEALAGLGTIAFRQGNTEDAERAFLRRLELVEPGGTPLEKALAFTDLARIALRRGDFAAVRSHAEGGYAAAQGDPQAIRGPLHLRAAAARMEGRLEEARALYLESRELNERFGNFGNVAGEDHNLVHVALHSGDREEAEHRFRTSSEWIFSNDNAYLRPYVILDAGILALHDGDLERAGRLVASAQRTFQDSDAIPDPDDRVELDDAIARLKERLGDRFDAVWAEGKELTQAEAVALARA